MDRELLLLAFGSPAEPDAKCALEIVLEAIHEEAEALSNERMKLARDLALACRLEALKTFVADYLDVSWKVPESEAAP